MGAGATFGTTAGDGALDRDLNDRIEVERAAALYGKGLAPYLSNVIVGAVEIVAVAPVVSPALRYGWLALMSAVTLLRLGPWLLHRRQPQRLPPRRWCWAFTVGGTMNGLVWGSTAFFLWGPGAAHHALLGFVVGGMVAGSTAVVPAFLPAFYTFATAALVPMALRLLATGETVDVTMGVLLLLFGLNMTRLARGAGRWFFENTELKLHLSRARDLLEDRVTERTAELVKTVGQLREAEARAQDSVRVRNDFLAVASHELRTPLATLELQVSRIEWHLAQPGAPARDELHNSVQALRRQVRRLTSLVDTLLTASGLAGQGVVLAPVELDLAAVVRSVVADATASTAAPNTPVSLALEQPLVGKWDPVRVEQVVANLVANALKYGGGKPVEIVLRAPDSEAVLEVRDHGPGIDPANRERIFERFFRADAGGQVGGLGLGLAVVRELVEVMHGAVTVESEPAQGTTFTVRLPRRPR